MEKILQKIKDFFKKPYARIGVYALFTLAVLVYCFSMTWAWFTKFVTPKNPSTLLSVEGESVTIKQIKIESLLDDDSTDIIYDSLDEDYNNSIMSGLILDHEYSFTIVLTSEFEGSYIIDIGITGIDGGNYFIGLDGNPTTLNMCDTYAFKLESITPDSTPAFAGSYDYRWLSSAKNNGGRFILVKNFDCWDSSLGDLTFEFTLKISSELTDGLVNRETISLKTLGIGNLFVSAKRVGG